MSELPEGWIATQLSQLLKSIVGGGTPSKANPAYFQGTIPFMTVKDLHARFVADTQDHISASALEDSASTLVPADTLIVATRMSLGKITRPLVPTAINQDLKALFLHEGVDKTYVEYLWRANEARIQGMGTGTTVKGIRLEDIRGLDVPLAPTAEQTRIANQLDTLLTRIQSCNDRFDAIPALLKRFRQAVTNAACSGALSAEWRGTAYFKDWKLQTLMDVCDSITDGDHQAPPQSNSGVPFITISAMNEGKLRLEKASRFVPQGYFDGLKPSRKPARGDLLFSVTGSIGIPAQVNTDEPFTFQRHIAILKPQKSLVFSPFIALALNTESMRRQVMEVATGTAQLTIPLSGIRKFVVNLPPIAEQTEIVRRVEALFALADRIEARATAARTHAQRLSSLVLAKAFRGELVQQDPQDEPASVLLQRLAATQPAKAKASRGRPRTKTQELFATPEGVQPDAAGLPDGMWAAPEAVDEHAVTAMLVAVLKAWGSPMPQMQARLAAVLCLQPRQMTAALPTEQAAQWQRLVGPTADPLPAQVARLQPAIDSAWRKALVGIRARGDLVEEGSGPQATWALGPGADQMETTGWPQGRAGWVVAYLRTQGAEAILHLLEPLTVEFVHARAA